MLRFRHLSVIASFLVALGGCTGESIKVVLPDQHPANPSAQEAPFVPPPDPFAVVTPPETPSPPEKPAEHRHGQHSGEIGDNMSMDDMRMDDDKGNDHMMHGGHGETGDGDRKELK